MADTAPIIVSDEVFWNLDIVRTVELENPRDKGVSPSSSLLDMRAGLLVSFVSSSAYGDERHIALVVGVRHCLHKVQISVHELLLIGGFQLGVVVVAAQVDDKHVRDPLAEIPDGVLLMAVSGKSMVPVVGHCGCKRYYIGCILVHTPTTPSFSRNLSIKDSA